MFGCNGQLPDSGRTGPSGNSISDLKVSCSGGLTHLQHNDTGPVRGLQRLGSRRRIGLKHLSVCQTNTYVTKPIWIKVICRDWYAGCLSHSAANQQSAIYRAGPWGL